MQRTARLKKTHEVFRKTLFYDEIYARIKSKSLFFSFGAAPGYMAALAESGKLSRMCCYSYASQLRAWAANIDV